MEPGYYISRVDRPSLAVLVASRADLTGDSDLISLSEELCSGKCRPSEAYDIDEVSLDLSVLSRPAYRERRPADRASLIILVFL